jgi:hypothetical protein
LSTEEHAAIEKYNLFDLKSFLPKKPTEVELKIIKEMFEASVDGEAFDMDRWGQYFKPDGMKGNNSNAQSNSAPASRPAPVASKPVAEDDETPPWDDNESPTAAKQEKAEAPAASGDAGSRAADIIAMIRKRQETK